MTIAYILIAAVQISTLASNEAGTAAEPVRVVAKGINLVPHEGGLRPAIGVASFQTMRANRTHPELADGFGWTYNHAPALTYWNGKFYQEYLSNPVHEHIAPGQTLITSSADGRVWSKPVVAFPPYEPPPNTPMPEDCNGYMMHQRMGFYIAPDGRLLALAFYGHAEDPFLANGIGRVVREVYQDGSFGPIYFIRYSSHTQWNESNTSLPFYTKSPDAGFVAACNALLHNVLMTRQWYDEDQGLDGFYPSPVDKNAEAFCWYHRADGTVVGLWKWSMCALSTDEGRTFSDVVRARTLIMDGAKIWGQCTKDGRYALVYNPTRHSEHRYPLAVVTGNDGITFDTMLLVNGEVPPRRFFGRWKDFGQQYTRGIEEGNGTPPGDCFWITYSINKEDMWVSRIPTPVRHAVEGRVEDTFDAAPVGGEPVDWNVYCPQWAPVTVAAFPNETDRSLELRDTDPYDYAKAVRVFAESGDADVRFRVLAKQAAEGMLDVELLTAEGARPVRLRFDSDGKIRGSKGSKMTELGAYAPDAWYDVHLAFHGGKGGGCSIVINGKAVLEKAPLADNAATVERICFRTGPFRDVPTRQTDNEAPHPPLPGADDPLPPAVFYIDSFGAASAN